MACNVFFHFRMRTRDFVFGLGVCKIFRNDYDFLALSANLSGIFMDFIV